MATDEPPSKARKPKVYLRPPNRLTLKQIEQALRASGGVQSVAADRLKVSPATVCRKVAKHHKLQVLITELTERHTDVAVGHLIAAVHAGKEWAIKKWLDDRGQSQGFGIRKLAFRDQQGQMMVPAVLVTNGRMSPDEFEAKYPQVVGADEVPTDLKQIN